MPRVSEVGGMVGFGGVYMHRPDLFKGFMFNYGLIWSHSTLPSFKRPCQIKECES